MVVSAMFLGVKFSERARPYFGGKSTNQAGRKIDPSVIEQKLTRYRTDWLALMRWDRQLHPVPVLAEVKLDRMMTSARQFLERQAVAPRSKSLPFLVGMAGGSASGKTTIKNEWLKALSAKAFEETGWRAEQHGPLTDQIELDHYYKNFAEQRQKMGDTAFFTQVNLDSPDAVALARAGRHVARLKEGEAVRIPHHTFQDSRMRPGEQLKVPAPFFFVEGLFTFVPRKLRELMDLKIFVAADETTRKERWWKRAVERNMDNEVGRVLFQRVMAMHDRHVEPGRKEADVVIDATAPLPHAQETLAQIAVILLRMFYPVKHT